MLRPEDGDVQSAAIHVEVLYFDGCPNFTPSVDLVRDVARELGVDVSIVAREVKDADDAARLRFPGSPTVRVDGNDVEPEVERRGIPAFGCRLYDGEGVPPRALIEQAIRGRMG